ncbi:hypothetical protein JCM6882_003059 [Rhodosporidiobolus microsporus]
MPGTKASQRSAGSAQRKSPRGKGKERASPPSTSASPDSPASTRHTPGTTAARIDAVNPADGLCALAERIADSAHLLVRGRGSEELAAAARDVAKAAFDQALQSESLSFPHLGSLLASLSPSAGPSTRSSAAARPSPSDEPAFDLAPTPISELTVDGMDPDMVWEQMELRGRTVDGLMDEMFGQNEEEDEGLEEEGDVEFDEDGSGGGEDEDESEGMDEEDFEEGDATPEDNPYFRRLGEGKEEGLDSEDWPLEDGEGSEDGQGSDLEPNGAEDAMLDSSRGLTLDNFDGAGKRSSQPRRSNGPPSAVDDAFFSLHDFHVDADEGEFEMEKMLKGDVDDDSDDDNDGGDEGIDLFASVGGSDAGDDEEEEEGDLDVAGLMYRDFFDPPSRPSKKPASKPSPVSKKPFATKPISAAFEEPPKKRGVRFSDAVKVKEIPHRLAGRNHREAAEDGASDGSDEEDDNEDEGLEERAADDDDISLADDALDGFGDEEMLVDGEDDAEAFEMSDDEDAVANEDEEVIQRFKSSLFDEDEDEAGQDKNLSRHERRLLQLSSQIASLEAENVGPKDWATLGEAQSRDRPVNSLLEEDLEFERMGKVAPMVTEETTRTIEDLIKKRILDNQFDDVERRRPVDPNAFLPSRYMELQDSKSQKSLAEVYEDEFRDAREREQGREVVHELDKDLQKKHDEIEALFEDLAARLDALSNARFTPKAPKATITTVSNLPSISVESALPTTNSTSALLAPEEVYAATGSSSALAIDKADLTPAQKKAQRQKAREQRKGQHEKAERILEAKQRRKGVKGEKERAEQVLLGTKGVTVIGKSGAANSKAGKKRKRGDTDGFGAGQPTGVALKL